MPNGSKISFIFSSLRHCSLRIGCIKATTNYSWISYVENESEPFLRRCMCWIKLKLDCTPIQMHFIQFFFRCVHCSLCLSKKHSKIGFRWEILFAESKSVQFYFSFVIFLFLLFSMQLTNLFHLFIFFFFSFCRWSTSFKTAEAASHLNKLSEKKAAALHTHRMRVRFLE